ncbi:leucine-rich repeat receptor-like protein kinase PXC1 [Magnolia sinica]|uniref:leucine-rich repeat receptor-like protein kinase PXC1 n=1 Tax=Magnolia sinica TaxID=86752 RepID=UPI002659C2AA|nr:leucine-rich repeat receptor-like protein kinase PXC1 [Magnolia sinica]
MEVPKPLTLAHHTVVFLLILAIHEAVPDEPTFPIGHQIEERDALYSLKRAFNHPLLNMNWDGLPCDMNSTNTTWYGISCEQSRVTGISLESLGLIGQVNVDALVNLSQLIFLSFRNNSISGSLMDFSTAKLLTHVDLSINMFDGPISPSLVGLDRLVSLQLQNNSLSGKIPPFGQQSLREFNVSNNNLFGEIPLTPVLQSFNALSYSNNQNLCGSPSPILCNRHNIYSLYGESLSSNPPTEPPTKKNQGFFQGTSLVAILAVFGLLALALVTYFFCVYYKKARSMEGVKKSGSEVVRKRKAVEMEKREERVATKEERENLSFMGNISGFELNDLLKASAEGLGKGSFGYSYKAMMDDRPTVVVKRLRDLNPLSGDEFGEQMRLLSDLKHPNLLPVIAYYHSREEKLMVCKFAENGNLFDRIHGGKENNRIPFRWSSRLSVARGVARAMAYLHQNVKTSSAIPHGNLKSSNVLFDENGVALVSDYGLSSLIAVPIAAQRMIAYKSPEYQTRRKISRKSDVWSYGCLLLELITGRMSSHSAPQGVKAVDLGTWVHKAVREEWTAEIFDLEITVQRMATEGAVKLLQIAIECCDKLPEKRPEMEDVVRELESVKGDYHSESDGEGYSYERSMTDESISSGASRGIGGER